MLQNPTAKQHRLLTTLHAFAEERGYMPSVRELGGVLGLSPATVQQHINALRRKGWLHSDGQAHGLSFTSEATDAQGFGAFERERSAAPSSAPSGGDAEPVKIVGSIAAGRPIEAFEMDDEIVTWPDGAARRGDFALRVAGRSMVDDGIFDGDLVLVRPQSTVENGEVAVALLPDGSATLKRIYREGDQVRLQPANTEMAPMIVPEVQIQGRVVGLLRRYS